MAYRVGSALFYRDRSRSGTRLGAVIGIFLLPVATGLVWWNESHAIDAERALAGPASAMLARRHGIEVDGTRYEVSIEAITAEIEAMDEGASMTLTWTHDRRNSQSTALGEDGTVYRVRFGFRGDWWAIAIHPDATDTMNANRTEADAVAWCERDAAGREKANA